jgi:hypothetical protein
MPGYTPVLRIPYPLVGETVDPTIFASFANVVDAAIAVNQASATYELRGKPTFAGGLTSGSFAPGTIAVNIRASFPTPVDNNSFFNSGNPTRCTFNTAGVYLVTVQSLWLAGASTATRWSADIFLNATTTITSGTQHPVNINEVDINMPLIWPFYAGDFIQVRFGWAGTGTGFIFDTGKLSVQYLCALS